MRTVVVVGGGTMGVAAAWVLARRGHPVTVLERFSHVHDFGSHGGHTRIIRQAYHEGSFYVPMVQRSDRLWSELGARCDEPLLGRVGMLEFGPPGDPEYASAIAACQAHGLEHEILSPAQARSRWPFEIPDDWAACFSPSGGFLRVGPCLDAMRTEAIAAGARFRYGARVREIDVGNDGPRVVLDTGDRVDGDHVVVTAGAYARDLLGGAFAPRLTVMRRLLAWTDPAPAQRGRLASLPVWGAFTPSGFFYGFPYGDEGIRGLKIARHTAPDDGRMNRPVDPETVDRQAHPADLDPLSRFITAHFSAAQGPFVDTKVCLYAVTPSWDFLVDRDPRDPRLVVAAGFSGHGFKFAPAIGELIADMVADDSARPPAQFRLS